MCNVHNQQHPDKISLGIFRIYLHSLIFSVGVGTETKRAKKESEYWTCIRLLHTKRSAQKQQFTSIFMLMSQLYTSEPSAKK